MDATPMSYRTLRIPLRLGAIFAAVAVLWACGDRNLFGPGQQAPPQIVDIQVPTEVKSGQTLDIRARAVGNVPLDSIVVRVRGAFSDEQTVQFEGGKVDATVDVSFAVPAEIADTTATVSVIAVDAQGNASSIGTTGVRIVDTTPPQVGVTLASEVVALGKTLQVTVEATDNVGLSEVGFRAFFIEGDTLVTETAVVSGFEGEQEFGYQVPADVAEGDLVVEVFASDVDGNSATERAGNPVQLVFVDEEPPAVSVTLPNVTGGSIPFGSDLLVHADFSDNGGVSSLRYQGLALRGDVEFGTDSAVVKYREREVTFDPPVTDSLVKRILIAEPSDTVGEVVSIIVTATDAQGNVGADTVGVTVEADTDRPTIAFVQPNEGAGFPAQDSVLVEVNVTEGQSTVQTGLTSVLFEGVSFVGDRELGTFQVIHRYQSKLVNFDPPESGTVNVKRYLRSTGDTTAATAYFRVTATDASGNVGKDSVEVQIGAPSVNIVTPEEGDEIAVNAQVTIQVTAKDPNGIESLEILDEGGDLSLGPDPLISETYSPAEDSVLVEQTFNVGANTGTIHLSATAVNSNGIEGTAGPIVIQVVQQAAADDEAPELRVSYQHGGSAIDVRRVELSDVLDLRVEGRDNSGGSGVEEVGVTLQAMPRNRAGPSLVIPLATVQYATPRSGTFTQNVSVPIQTLETAGVLELISAPDTVDMTLHAYMVDAQDNCGAATSPTDFQSLTCALQAASDTVAQGLSGQPDFVVGVSGQTVRLPGGGSIADAVVDEPRNQLVMSNIGRGRLEVFDLGTNSFGASVLVGAEPWGLTFDRATPSDLYVANSAGTNISIVDMAAGGGPTETGRIFTPNTVLREVDQTEDDDGTNVLNPPRFFDFSDRPQFIAQDMNENLVYSTLPTTAAPNGTIRLGITNQGPDTEVVLYTGHAELLDAEQTYPLGNIDGVTIDASGANDVIQIIDHDVGDESTTRTSTFSQSPAAALDDLVTNNANVYANPFPATTGAWDIPGIGLGDTTFVAAAGDGSLVAIGEGATAPTGRIMIYTAPNAPATPRDHVGSVSSVVDVVDLVGNQAERVLGVALNQNGTLGVARGLFAVYFFSPSDLRLQGSAPVSPGGAGVALHPLHNNGPPNKTNANARFAFAGTGDRNVEIFDTWHFTKIGSVAIRQQIVGQIRAILPTNADQPAGLPSCTDPTQQVTIGGGQTKQIFNDFDGTVINPNLADECVVLKLTGITDNQGVVVIPVTKADIIRTHPAN